MKKVMKKAPVKAKATVKAAPMKKAEKKMLRQVPVSSQKKISKLWTQRLRLGRNQVIQMQSWI